MKRLQVSHERVLELFDYDDGKLFHKSNNEPAKIYVTKGHRYARIKFDKQEFKLHRIIFLYHKGYLPDIIDHINVIYNIQNRKSKRSKHLSKPTEQ